jgi:hypothetical protein
VAAGLTAALTAILTWSPAAAATSPRSGLGDDADRTSSTVVVLGVTGLSWRDVSSQTPTLAALGDQATVANAAVRTIRTETCPLDGWLTFSAGARAADRTTTACREVPAPTDGRVPGWAALAAALADDGYEATPGRLGAEVAAARIPTAGIGPGAGVALTGPDGALVGPWAARAEGDALGAQVADALDGGARLLVVDLGSADDAGVQGLDARVAAAMSTVPEDATVLLASLADAPHGPALQLVAARGPGLHPGLLTSSSTRQPGLVLGTDLTATVEHLLGLDVDDLDGAPVRQGPAVSRAVWSLADAARHAEVSRALVPGFTVGLAVIDVVVLLGAWLALGRRRGAVAPAERRRRALTTLRTTMLLTAALPAAVLAANTVPWWRAPAPGLALAATALALAGAATAVALVGPWRRAPMGPAGAVAAVTAVVILLDIVTGARVQLSAVLGTPTLVAGRFYGAGNSAFAMLTAASLFAAAALAVPLVRARRRPAAAGVVAAVGVLVTVVDGLPGMGADFGGPPALIPAFIVLALLVGGAGVTWRRLGIAAAVAAGVTAGVAVLDWLRPADQRTHLGGLVQTIIDGGFLGVVGRKIATSMQAVGDSLLATLATIALVVVAGFLVAAPVRAAVRAADGGRYGWLTGGRSLSRLGVAAPTLSSCLVATGVALTLGFLVNDSGISIPTLGAAVTLPLVLASAATWLLQAGPGGDGPAPATTPSTPSTEVAPELAPDAVPAPDAAPAPETRPDPTTPGTATASRTPGGRAPGTVLRRAGLAAAAATLALTTLAAPATAADGPSGAPDAAASDAPAPPVVLVGVAGLRWSDVSVLLTPELWDLSRSGGVGLVAARSLTGRACPADGWLAVSAGARAADATSPDGTCRSLTDPTDGATVPAWSDYLAAVATQPYDARPGRLGDALSAAGVPVAGFGPGAAIAIADHAGTPVGAYAPMPQTVELGAAVRGALTSSRLVVVDAGVIRDPDPTPTADGTSDASTAQTVVALARAEQVRNLDARVGAALDAARRSGATFLLASLADPGSARLQLVAATGPAPRGGGYDGSVLTSGSTRQLGLVQTTDVTPTVLGALGLRAPALVGADIRPGAGPATAQARAELVGSIDAESWRSTRVSGSFTTRLVVGQVALVAIAAFLLLRRRSAPGPIPASDPIPASGPGPASDPGPAAPASPAARTLLGLARRAERPALRVLQVGAVALAAMPAASFLAGLVPWWRTAAPTTSFWLVVLGWAALVTAVAFAGPWRRSVLGPACVVAAVTFTTLVGDLLTGSSLMIDAPMGAQRILAARFYGASNQAYALLTVAGVLVALTAADLLVRRGLRRTAAAVVVAIGLVATVVDGLPSLGSDVGGPPSIVLAFAVLALAAAGTRVSWKPVVAVVAVAGLVVLGLMVLDYRRPADERTHLGRFLATALDGGLWDVLWRKASVNLRVLTNWRYLVLALSGTGLAVALLRRPRATAPDGAAPDTAMSNTLATDTPGTAAPALGVPLLRTAFVALALAMALGFAINDSGIVIPATGVALAVPCLVAMTAQARLRRD